MTCVASGGDTAPGRPVAAPSENKKKKTGAGVMRHCSGVTAGLLKFCVCVCLSIMYNSVKNLSIF